MVEEFINRIQKKNEIRHKLKNLRKEFDSCNDAEKRIDLKAEIDSLKRELNSY